MSSDRENLVQVLAFGLEIACETTAPYHCRNNLILFFTKRYFCLQDWKLRDRGILLVRAKTHWTSRAPWAILLQIFLSCPHPYDIFLYYLEDLTMFIILGALLGILSWGSYYSYYLGDHAMPLPRDHIQMWPHAFSDCIAENVNNAQVLSVPEVWYNNTVEYDCEPGYTHEGGDLTRTCLDNGVLSGEPPICTGKYRLVLGMEHENYYWLHGSR